MAFASEVLQCLTAAAIEAGSSSVAQCNVIKIMCAGLAGSATPPTPHIEAPCSQHSLVSCSSHQHCRAVAILESHQL